MAIDPTEYGLTPDESVANQKVALDKYTNVAQPALLKQQQAERGGLMSDVSTAAMKNAYAGAPQASSGMLGKAALAGAQLLPQQQSKIDEMARTGASMEQNIITQRQANTVKNYSRATEEAKEKADDFLAKRSFQMGVTAKEMLLHQSGYVADRALSQMYSDLGENRENAADVRKLQSQIAVQARYLTNKLQQDKAELMWQLKLDLANRDFAAAKERYAELTRRTKEVMETQAKSSGLAKILGAAATVATTYYTGGNVAAGMAAGKVAEGATTSMQNQ